MKIAKEGYPFIVFFLVLTLAALFALPIWIAPLFLALTLFMVYFFRDPDRIIPAGDSIFVSPADGKIIDIGLEDETVFINSKMLKISVFMSPLNVHVNRSPCDGKVEIVSHTPGRFLSAFKPEASALNENIAMVLDTRFGKIVVRQIAGFVARRAVCRAQPGQFIKKGERFGIIKFSSRVDIFIPAIAIPEVKRGDRVVGGETIIGRMP